MEKLIYTYILLVKNDDMVKFSLQKKNEREKKSGFGKKAGSKKINYSRNK